MSGRTFLSAPPTERQGRYPKHTFQVQSMPFTTQPFFIAPVLPSETLTSLFFESRVITDPVRNPIIGWKQEYFFFYVKISDLQLSEFKEMFVNPTLTDLVDSTAYDIAADARRTYGAKGSIDYVDRCMTRIVDEYFRDDGETRATAQLTTTFLSGTPIVQIREKSWLDSITTEAAFPSGPAIAGATNADDLDRLLDAFEQLRALGLSDMTYEDFLRSYGINIPERDENRPELLAHFSEFQYPSNAVDYNDGSVSSAVSWVFKNGERKPKFFKEPGFIIGLSVTRPKVYFGGLAGNLAGFMTRAWDWMPNYMHNMPETSLKQFAADVGPLGDQTVATVPYWVDMRDLLIHGDQFQNVVAFNPAPVTVGANHILPLPVASDAALAKWKYPDDAMIKEFFTTPASAFYVKQDGYVSLSLKGKQVDYTTGTLAVS